VIISTVLITSELTSFMGKEYEQILNNELQMVQFGKILDNNDFITLMIYRIP
jgi:hypothetical protein